MKKLLIPVIALILGFGIGYISNTKPPCSSLAGGEKQNLNNASINFKFGPWKWIPRSPALKMIDDFQAWNQEQTHPTLGTSSGKKLKGFFISKVDLDDIMSKKTPDTKGISVYMAKDASSPSNSPVFTLVFMRADTNLLYNKPGDKIGTPYINEYDGAYDFVKPCPDDCGNFETAIAPPIIKSTKKGK